MGCLPLQYISLYDDCIPYIFSALALFIYLFEWNTLASLTSAWCQWFSNIIGLKKISGGPKCLSVFFFILTLKKNYRHTTGSLLPECIWSNSLGSICVLYGSQKNYRWDNILFYNLKITEDFLLLWDNYENGMQNSSRSQWSCDHMVLIWQTAASLSRLKSGLLATDIMKRGQNINWSSFTQCSKQKEIWSLLLGLTEFIKGGVKTQKLIQKFSAIMKSQYNV